MARRDSGKKAAKGGKQLRSSRKAKPKAKSETNLKGSPEAKTGWPLHRHVFFRPERVKYVRKQIPVSGCVFCSALAKERSKDSLVLFSDDAVMVILNKYPYNTGHLLVLPRRHEGGLTDMTKDEVARVFEMAQRCVKFLGDAYKPSGFNIGLNLGAAAGAGIPEHLHMHVIPRWPGDTNFFPLIAQTKVVVETLEQTFERLLPYFHS